MLEMRGEREVGRQGGGVRVVRGVCEFTTYNSKAIQKKGRNR